MPQLRTVAEFSSAITSDLTWRIREISDLRTVVKRVDASLRPSVLRAGVPLIYAHWEGHVVMVGSAYVEFISIRRPDYAEIKPSFRLKEFFRELVSISQSQTSYKQKIELIYKILASGDKKFRRVDEQIITAMSNLNSTVLGNLCEYLSIDVKQFEDDYDFIDKILLYRRNNIAHGQYISVDEDGLEQMSDRVIKIMRLFNNLIENDVVLGAYRV
jgi:hypothetical protein